MSGLRLIRIGDIVQPRREKASPSNYSALPYIGLEHVEAHSSKLLGCVPALEMRSTANKFYKGDVLYARLRPYLNKVWRADRDGLCSTEFIVLPGNENINADFLRYRLNSQDFVLFANHLNTGDRPRVDFDQIANYEVLVPDALSEQHRIVAEIEKQFTRLNAGMAALQRAQANLKRYRAAVLKAACEGTLVPTEAKLAGAEGRSYESGAELLQRILAERRAKWNGRRKYKEPAAPDAAGLAELPAGWCWASLEQLSWSSSYGTSAKCGYEKSGPPVLRIPNIESGRVNLSDLKYADAKELIEPSGELLPGDLLIIRTNGSKNLIGRSALIRDVMDRQFGFASYLIRFRLLGNSTLQVWLAEIWDSRLFRDWIEFRAATSAGQHNISMGTLNTMPIPLPPLAEQRHIVAEVERRLSVIEEMEAAVSANLQRGRRLRQSILQNAFAGEL